MRRAPSLLLLVTTSVYVNSLGNAFQYDDEHLLTRNQSVRGLANIPAFFDPGMFSRNPGSEMYRPLVLVSYALNYNLGGYDVREYHFFNLLVHTVCGCLVYGALSQLFGGNREVAFLDALLFAIHPVTTEPVNYISSRSESMAVLFVLLRLSLFIKFAGGVTTKCYGPPWSVSAWPCFSSRLLSSSR